MFYLFVIAVVVVALCFVRKEVVQEATAVTFKYLGQYVCCVMEFKGHHFDKGNDDGFIRDDLDPNHLGPGRDGIGTEPWCIWRVGGWVLYIRGLVEPTKYNDQNAVDGFGKGVSVFLNGIQREVVEQAKTKEGDNITLVVKAIFKMRVVNPYLFLFVAPKDVIDQAMKTMKAAIRAWVIARNEEGVQSQSEQDSIWKGIQNHKKSQQDLKKLKDEWGIEVIEESVSITGVDYDSGYKEALESKKKAGLLAQAEAAKLGGPLKIMMDQWVADEATRAGVPADTNGVFDKVKLAEFIGKLMESGAYGRKEEMFEELRARGLAGSNFSKDESSWDITSGGERIDPNYAAILAGARAFGGAFRQQRRQDKHDETGGGQQNKPAGQPSPAWIKRHGGGTAP